MTTATVAYDRPVRNLISQLSATGHVSHTSYTKKSVTFHHNGGRLSHDGVLNVWKTRPASAHFDSDSSGAIAQYVKVTEYAWAAGSLKGNQESIHIEMANSKVGPTWEVGEDTWKSAARLAGWLFAKVIKAKPTKSNVFVHSHWSATACAGPYITKTFDDLLKEVQESYEYFTKKASTPSSPNPSTPGKKSVDEVAKDVIAGHYGNGPARVRALIAAGYNAAKVQARVDELMNPPRGQKSVKTVAAEVLQGKWGNNPSRAKDLKEAGYNPLAVQREVNELVKKNKKR